ncbi:MAG TPA: histidine phosphatase family protein [Chloroflexota bacterium]|nr:histidine phosphatase family protein [Chloroflexota bacterium]
MIVYIVRHAPAGQRDPSKWPDDSARPLTKKGERKFARAAAGLGAFAQKPAIVLSSPYARAWRTAELLEEHAGWPAPTVCAALAGSADPADVIPALVEHARAEGVALVGHEPNVSELTSLLLIGDAGRAALPFKKGGTACLSGDPAPGRAHLEWFLTPGQLRSIAG